MRQSLSLLVMLLVCVGAAAGATPPRVVVTVMPVHSLVAAVSVGVTEPVLLLAGGVSPHHYALRPSQVRVLQDADLVVWVGPTLETFLTRTLHARGHPGSVMTVMTLPGITVDPTRPAGPFLAPSADTPSPARHGSAGHHEHHQDPHIWLDPDNAKTIVDAVAAALAALDPDNAARYRHNAGGLHERITALDASMARTLAPVRDVPFVVFHDAYHGLERRYGLHAAGSVTVSPGRAPGAARLVALRRRIIDLGARCVFSEPQFPPQLVDTLVEGTGARSAVLDPLGADLEPGADAWFTLMERLAASLADCLGTP